MDNIENKGLKTNLEYPKELIFKKSKIILILAVLVLILFSLPIIGSVSSKSLYRPEYLEMIFDLLLLIPSIFVIFIKNKMIYNIFKIILIIELLCIVLYSVKGLIFLANFSL